MSAHTPYQPVWAPGSDRVRPRRCGSGQGCFPVVVGALGAVGAFVTASVWVSVTAGSVTVTVSVGACTVTPTVLGVVGAEGEVTVLVMVPLPVPRIASAIPPPISSATIAVRTRGQIRRRRRSSWTPQFLQYCAAGSTDVPHLGQILGGGSGLGWGLSPVIYPMLPGCGDGQSPRAGDWPSPALHPALILTGE